MFLKKYFNNYEKDYYPCGRSVRRDDFRKQFCPDPLECYRRVVNQKGGTAKTTTVENLGIEAGLVYSWFTDKTEGVKQNFHALNLPVKAKYCFPLNNEFGFFALAGPTFALGLSATNKDNGATLDLFENYLKRFDIKLGIGAGVCYNDLIEFRVGYDWSLLNISQVSGRTGHLNYLHIGLAYKF